MYQKLLKTSFIMFPIVHKLFKFLLAYSQKVIKFQKERFKLLLACSLKIKIFHIPLKYPLDYSRKAISNFFYNIP